MRWIFALFSALTLTSLTTAGAQTRIGTVTLTKATTPAQPQNRPASQNAASTSMASVPAGWVEVRGRISAGAPVTLPVGSTVTVVLENQTSPATVVRVQFKTRRLSTPYQLIFSPGRLNSRSVYTVRSVITDASGKTLYQSSAIKLPSRSSSVIDLTVR